MDMFEIQGADGEIYEIEAPDQQSAISAFQSSGIGGGAPKPAPVEAPAGFSHVGSFGDGDVFKRDNGQLAFKSPGRSTIDQDEIREIMAGGAQPDTTGAAEGSARSFLQGATLGFGDEIVAAGAAALDPIVNNSPGTFQERFDARVGDEREDIADFKRTNPGTALATEIAGGLTTATAAGLGGATLLRGGQTLPQAAGAGLVEGAIYGGATGAGQAEGGLQNRIRGGVAGAATGAAVGAAAAPVVAGAKAITEPVTDAVKTAFGSADNRAAARIASALRQTGQSTDEVAAKLDDIGEDAFLADALGSPGQRLARATANADPAAEGILRTASRARTAGQPDRLTQRLLDASGLGSPQTIDELVDAQRRAASPAINEAYDAARQAGFDLPNEPFRDINRAPLVQDAIKEAETSVLNRAVIEGQDAGSKLAVFDEAKKILDDKASKAFRRGENNAGGTASALARQLRDTVDNSIPEYAGARQLAQNSARSREAIELGAEGARNNIPVDFGRRVAAVNPADQTNVAQGYAADKIAQIQNRRATPGVVDGVFGSNQQQSALQQALGNRAAPVQKQIANEQIFGNTARALEGNSTTAQQLSDLANGQGIGGLVRQGAQAVRNVVTAGKEQEVAPRVAQMLLERGVPQSVIDQANTNPAIQQALIRWVSGQTGGIGAELNGVQ